MEFVTVFLGGTTLIFLFLWLLQRKEIKSITSQLEQIGMADTNEQIHSQGGSKPSLKLICEINLLLKNIRQTKMDYAGKSHTLEQMMLNISHDLRTPLTSAMGYVEMVQSSDLPQEQEREIAIVGQRLSRLEELLDSFFEFFAILSADKLPEKEPLNLVSLLEESIAHFYDDYSRQNRRISFYCDRRKVEISSNYHMLLRIFDNLISNAYKHGSGDLHITVEMGDALTVSFENPSEEGEADVNRIFDEFYTTDISRTKGNTGLGLAIAKQFTQMLGGQIDAGYRKENFWITIKF